MPKYDPEAVVSILEPGQYEAVVKKAIDERSKGSGNEQIKLILTCYTPGGAECDVFDYLVFTPSWLPKIRGFCDSAGLDFARGELDAADCQGRNVRVNLSIERSASYPDKNKVDKYVPRNGAIAPAGIDDDIPF